MATNVVATFRKTMYTLYNYTVYINKYDIVTYVYLCMVQYVSFYGAVNFCQQPFMYLAILITAAKKKYLLLGMCTYQKSFM